MYNNVVIEFAKILAFNEGAGDEIFTTNGHVSKRYYLAKSEKMLKQLAKILDVHCDQLNLNSKTVQFICSILVNDTSGGEPGEK